MIFLGIDPGTRTAGFSIMQKKDGKILLLDYGALVMKPTLPLSERIGILYAFFKTKIETYQVNFLVLETPFAGKNLQVFLKLGYVRGIVYLLVQQHALTLQEYAPQEIKLAVTGFGHADKEQVARTIIRLFPGLTHPEKLDITDALSVTLCGIWKYKKQI